jgi:hypothetical protein
VSGEKVGILYGGITEKSFAPSKNFSVIRRMLFVEKRSRLPKFDFWVGVEPEKSTVSEKFRAARVNDCAVVG